MIPSNVRIGLSTIFVDDNIDQNSSSPTASLHFHGTEVTILQFPSEENQGTEGLRPKFSELLESEKKVDFSILDSYTTVTDARLSVKNAFCPIQRVTIPEEFSQELNSCYRENCKTEHHWLNTVCSNILEHSEQFSSSSDAVNMVSWTSFHTKRSRDSPDKTPTINALLPVIYHISNDINPQAHVMTVAKQYTKFINEEQTTVGCSDQPLYAWKKKLQWAYPSEFSTESYFAFMGGLHTEQQLLKINGQLIKGTGIDEIIDQAGLPIIGLKTALCDVNDIKKARYTVQVIAPCLYKNLMFAHAQSNSELDIHE